MTKANLVEVIHNETGIEKVTIRTVIDQFTGQVKSSLEKGENVYIRGFGSYTLKKRARKVGRDIGRGKAIEIPEHFIPYFKPSNEFKELVSKQ